MSETLTVALRVKTALSIETIEEWLERNCAAAFQVHFEGLSDDRVKKELLVLFEDDADKDLFKAAYQRREIG